MSQINLMFKYKKKLMNYNNLSKDSNLIIYYKLKQLLKLFSRFKMRVYS